MVLLQIPMHIQTPNVREHWRARHARIKTQRHATTLALLAAAKRPTLPVAVTLTRCSNRALDSDNLVFSFKGVRDAIANWLGCDDSTTSPVTWYYEQEKVARGENTAVRILITELSK